MRKSDRLCPINPDHEVVVNDTLREEFDYCKDCQEDIDYLRKQKEEEQVAELNEELENQDKDREHIVGSYGSQIIYLPSPHVPVVVPPGIEKVKEDLEKAVDLGIKKMKEREIDKLLKEQSELQENLIKNWDEIQKITNDCSFRRAGKTNISFMQNKKVKELIKTIESNINNLSDEEYSDWVVNNFSLKMIAENILNRTKFLVKNGMDKAEAWDKETNTLKLAAKKYKLKHGL